MKRLIASIFAFPLLCMSGHANAWDTTMDVKVTAIELTYMPGNVPFMADRAVGSCAAGTFLGWTPKGATQDAKDKNAQAVLAALMTAKASGASVRVFVTTSTCQVDFLYLL